MGEDPGTAGARLGAPDASPEELRRRIAHTREELGDTVAALVRKTDVKARTRERLTRARGQAPGRARAALAGARREARAHPAGPLAGALIVAGWAAWRRRGR